MKKELFGKLDACTDIYKYTIENESATLTVMERGATITRFSAFGRDIVGAFDSLSDYILDTSHQGAIIGRVANRVENAKFEMDGKIYALPQNDGKNCLHGGDGFDHRIWKLIDSGDDFLTFEYVSADGEEGFPSSLKVEVKYTLKEAALIIEYKAIPDGKTPIALTNHSYFNLDGFGGTIENHTAEIFADRYTAVSGELIPTGERPSVIGTVFDFTKPKKIGQDLSNGFIGYDHNFILSPTEFDSSFGKELGLAARICSGGLSMKVYTDQPGIQFYIGNFLGGEPDFSGGVKKIFHGAFCLETQTEPNCINRGIGFYEEGEAYTHTTVYKIERI